MLLREECNIFEYVLDAMHDDNVPRNCQLFAKAMYIFDYQYNQKIMEQALAEMDELLMNYNGAITNSVIRNVIFCTQSYDDIVSSIVLCEKITENPKLADEITQFLSKHNIHLESNEIISLSRKIEYRMRKMLRKIIVNAYYYFKKGKKRDEKSE